ncbi:MAG: hypothetical protein IAE90_03240 [Ignavibacteria bacterium]|nr:hypothetical protein [Ignavibacteria bacterium]
MTNKINYDIPVSGRVTIKVVDIIGTPVRILFHEHEKAGSFEIDLGEELLSPGKYYYKVILYSNGEDVSKGNKEELISTGQIKVESSR